MGTVVTVILFLLQSLESLTPSQAVSINQRLEGYSQLTSVEISSNSGPCCIEELLEVPAVAPPKREELARKAILALSKLGETVRISRLKGCLSPFVFGSVRGAVKECRRANTCVPVNNLKVRSRIEVLYYVA